MEKVTRFSISVDTELLRKYDSLLKEIGYSNRSEAIRDLIRERLIKEEWKVPGKKVVGVLALVYDHGTRELTEVLNQIQHRYVQAVIASLHVHLDAHNCLEIIVLKGTVSRVKKIAQELLTLRNVKHGQLTMTTTGVDIP
ncbi:nickel-responsive transcriptional regulator NikR [Candidatus Aminicenantes bacterium AC-334-K16]|jgi:CopG family nickel-responsive transcriptional regulator|nr:nickel-responsive transcriptional regulator NikR [Candidatus Aminicenantes bacterium AC-334-K16]